MKKKILITGAAGFIGSHLIDLLLEEGATIGNLRLFVKNNESLENLPRKKLDIIYGDIRDKNAVRKAMEGIETVYHLAAKIDFEGKDYKEYKEINVEGTQNILDCCKEGEIQKFVFFSSIAVFGLPADIGNILNWNETHPKTYTNFYGRSKLEAEKRVLRAFDEKKIPYIIIRPASVYGPREKGPTFELYKAIKKHLFFIVSNGNNKMHYVYVKDLVKGARQAQLSKTVGDYILAGVVPTTLNDVAKNIAASIGESIPSFHLPKSFVYPLSFGIDSLSKLFRFKSPISPSRVRTMTSSYYYDIGKSQREIGYDPGTSFEEGSKETGKWYLQNQLL